MNVAQAEGVYVVNTGSDMSSYGPDAVLASVTHDWTDYFVREIGAKLDGSFKGGDERGGLAQGMVEVVAYSGDLSEDQLAEIEAAEAAFISGDDHPFTGPIIDQDGKERVAAGEVLADPDIFSMDWLVQGVGGNIPD